MDKITTPTTEEERLLNDVVEENPFVCSITGTRKKYSIGWMKVATRRKITSLYLEKGNDDSLSCKVAAAIVLNSFWKMKLIYPILWRYWFYVKEYEEEQLSEILVAGKKKVPHAQSLINIMLVTGMRDTIMRMRKEEASRTLQELSTESTTV